MDIMNDAGVEIPGVKEETTIEDDDVHKVARQLLGKRLAKCFKSAGPQASEASSNNVCITVDGHLIERKSHVDESRNNRHIYRFSSDDRPASSNAPSDGSSNKTRTSSNTSNDCASFYSGGSLQANNGDPLDALDEIGESAVSPGPPDVLEI